MRSLCTTTNKQDQLMPERSPAKLSPRRYPRFAWVALHPWKRATRSASRTQDTVARIILGIVIGLLALNLLSIGLFLEQYIALTSPASNPVHLLNGFLLYYLAAELVLRLLLQRVPGHTIEPYLLLPVRRSLLVHMLLGNSALSLFNILPLLVVVPVCFTVIAPRFGTADAAGWLGAIIGFLIMNSYLQLFAKRSILRRPQIMVVLTSLVLAAGALDRFDLIPVTALSRAAFGTVLVHPSLALIPWGLAIALYIATYRSVRAQVSLEYLSLLRGRTGGASMSFHFLDRFGDAGRYMALELKLLLRNRRARAQMVFALSMVPVIIAMCVWMFSVIDFYPRPDELREETDTRAAGDRLVSFCVRTDQLPPDAHVYVAGDHEKLGGWKPARVPLLQRPDGSWSRTFAFAAGTALIYKFNLGSWETVMISDDGTIPPNLHLTVAGDTTVSVQVAGWKTPEPQIILDINLMYMTLLLTLLLMMSYGQFMLAWESNYFDLLLAGNVAFPAYFRAKFSLLVAGGCASFLVSLPAILFVKGIVDVLIVTALYNLGVNSFVLLFMSTYNKKRMDLAASIFGMQGKGSIQFLTILPTLFAPILIFLPTAMLTSRMVALMMMAGLGVLGLLAHPFLLRLIIRQFQRKRYAMAAGFRQPS